MLVQRISALHSPACLELVEVDEPEANGRVLVDIDAAGVNYSDLLRSGHCQAVNHTPYVPGSEAARGARRGVATVSTGLFRGPQALRVTVGRELVLTGPSDRRDGAREAGFVNVVTAPSGAVAGALDPAAQICENSPAAVRARLLARHRWLASGEECGWTLTEEARNAVLTSDDYRGPQPHSSRSGRKIDQTHPSVCGRSRHRTTSTERRVHGHHHLR